MPINTKKLGSSWLLVKANTPNASGILYRFEMLVEMCNTDPHLEMRGDELWYREIPIPKVTDQKGMVKVILPFDSFSTCFKCGKVHLFKQPLTKYNSAHDILEKSCINCGYTWWEQTQPRFKKG